MREIKFRVWKDLSGINEETGEFEKSGFMFEPKDSFVYELNHVHESWSVMQYTGLKDKNGKEIYEGDVVNVYDEIGGEATMGQKFERFTVKVQDYAFMAFLEQMVGECEVIGNIYENPELLTQ